MRLFSFAALAAIAVSTPACTVIGISAGASLAKAGDRPRDSRDPDDANPPGLYRYELIGGAIGAAVDLLVIEAIKLSLDASLGGLFTKSCASCD